MPANGSIWPLIFAFNAFVFFAGASAGSFLNVCIYRLPAGRSIVKPRSSCPYCTTAIAWYDNVPVLSWLWLRARCRHCGIPISVRYPMVEAATGLLAVALVRHFGPGAEAFFVLGETSGFATAAVYFVLCAALIVVTLVDWDHRIVPDEITLPGIAAGIAASFVLPISWIDSILGAVAGGGILFAVAWGYRLFTRREGMGMGDVKLLAMLGAFLGWAFVPFSLLFASLAGSVYGLILVGVKGRSMRYAFAFGPFLAGSGIVYIFWGERILAWYLGRA